MAQHLFIQGRNITEIGIDLIRQQISAHTDWGRTRLSEEL